MQKGKGKMIQIEKAPYTGKYTPQTNEEANGEIMGRCNALHDWLYNYAIGRSKSQYVTDPLDTDLRIVAALMGFEDVLAIKMENATGED